MPRDELLKWNDFCRNKKVTTKDDRGKEVERPAPIRFIAAGVMGVLGYHFSDFGEKFRVNDEFGEPLVRPPPSPFVPLPLSPPLNLL